LLSGKEGLVLISKSKKFLFIHIQKTAGRSFEVVLKKNLPDLESFMGERKIR